MEAQMIVYNDGGKEGGPVKVSLDFTAKTWNVEDDLRRAWPSSSKSGPIAVISSREMVLQDTQPGRPLMPLITFNDFPTSESESGSAGVGKIVAGGYVFVGRISPQLSAVRATMLSILAKVPNVVSSKEAAFQTLTGLTQKTLEDYWALPAGNNLRNFTSCNAFLGATAKALGAKEGSWLSKGVLELRRCDNDVKGSWILAKDNPGKRPQLGDFYSVSMLNADGWMQEYGHVGIVAQINKDGSWMSVDGGQGGRKGGVDYVKRVPRGSLADFKFKGWCDIDIYFAGK